jgi:hypothetical protein
MIRVSKIAHASYETPDLTQQTVGCEFVGRFAERRNDEVAPNAPSTAVHGLQFAGACSRF